MTTLEVLEPEFHIIELKGFFNGLRCAVGHSSGRFSADLIMKDGREILAIVDDTISFISKSGLLISQKIVDYKYVWRLFDTFIYKKIPHLDHEQQVNLDWNLIEYYGLISTAENDKSSVVFLSNSMIFLLLHGFRDIK